MFTFPNYKELPKFILGQSVKITLKAEHKKAKNRNVEGKIIYVSKQIITVEKSTGKESICLVDFKTGNAFLNSVY